MPAQKAIIPFSKIPKFCPFCAHPVPEEERQRQTHPFLCSNTAIPKPHQIFVSPLPVAVHILLVRLDDGRLGVCLGRRGLVYEIAFGKWALPGGYIEGETGEEAAIHEFGDEVGVDVSTVLLQHVAERYDPATFCSLHFYAGIWPHSDPPELQITEETTETMICPIDELPEDMAFPYQKEIIIEAAMLFA